MMQVERNISVYFDDINFVETEPFSNKTQCCNNVSRIVLPHLEVIHMSADGKRIQDNTILCPGDLHST